MKIASENKDFTLTEASQIDMIGWIFIASEVQ
jgi:hypothetical protein